MPLTKQQTTEVVENKEDVVVTGRVLVNDGIVCVLGEIEDSIDVDE